jgi:hypothetical protein
MTAPMHVPRFFIRQRITMMVNRYEIRGAAPDGSEGPLLAFAQQKRMKLREEVVFYADESRSRAVFSFKARQRLDVHAEHDVFDEYGNALGYFRKEFGASLLRSTWRMAGPGYEAIPFLGDIWVPFVFHFDFVDPATGQPVLSSERKKAIRDRYVIDVPDPRVDFRVAASMAVALDALQSR